MKSDASVRLELKAGSLSFILMVTLFITTLTGCMSPAKRMEMSATILESKFNPSKERVQFLCSFGFQSSLSHYVKGEIPANWSFGSCILERGGQMIYLGSLPADDPPNPLDASIHAIKLSAYQSFAFSKRGRSLLDKTLSMLSHPMDVQLLLDSRELSQETWSGVKYPINRVIINFEASREKEIREVLSYSGLRQTASQNEVLAPPTQIPVDPFMMWGTFPRDKGR